MSYENFDNLFEDLYSTSSSLTYQNFNGSTLEGLTATIGRIWKNMLDKIGMTPLGPFSEENIGPDTVFGYIERNIDYDSDISDYIYNGFWNESVDQLVRDFQNTFGDNGTLYGNVTVNDLKNADAGNSFSWGAMWVKPWTNKSGQSYSIVRGDDVIPTVITYNYDLNFTNRKGDWLRLLMPRYSRYVEVEDLNRNFWVISSVLTAVCDFIFGDNLRQILNSYLNEIMQLWQNTQYLWGTYAVLSQEPYYTDVHCEIVPVPVDELRNYIKFDNFSQGYSYSGLAGLQNANLRLQYLKEQYPESNLCIAPFYRCANYEHNYYEAESYPGFIFYDRNRDLTFYYYCDTSKTYITTEKYKTQIAALDIKNWNYINNYENSAATSPSDPIYYGILRVIPTSFTVEYGDQGFSKLYFTTSVHDVAYEATRDPAQGAANRPVGGWTVSFPSIQANQMVDRDITNSISVTVVSGTPNRGTSGVIKPYQGFYMGELVTGIKRTTS